MTDEKKQDSDRIKLFGVWYYTKLGAARALNVSTTSVERRLREGVLKAYTGSGKVLIPEEALQEYVKRNTQ